MTLFVTVETLLVFAPIKLIIIVKLPFQVTYELLAFTLFSGSKFLDCLLQARGRINRKGESKDFRVVEDLPMLRALPQTSFPWRAFRAASASFSFS